MAYNTQNHWVSLHIFKMFAVLQKAHLPTQNVSFNKVVVVYTVALQQEYLNTIFATSWIERECPSPCPLAPPTKHHKISSFGAM
jgi:hypothetical protein